jgi:hypothetical protein
VEPVLVRLARPRPLLVLTVIAVGHCVGVNTLDFTGTVPYFKRISGGAGFPDMQLYYDAARAHEILGALGPTGRSTYLVLLSTFDVVFPAVVAVFLRAAMVALYGGEGPRGLRVVPWIAMALDYAENVSCAILVATYPTEPFAVATAAGFLTAAKDVAYVTGVLTVLAAIPVAVARRARVTRIGSGGHPGRLARCTRPC